LSIIYEMSFNIGLVEVESCTISKTIFVITFFGHCGVFSRDVEIVRFVYIILFLIYHGNM
jgi:hypothetical protein